MIRPVAPVRRPLSPRAVSSPLVLMCAAVTLVVGSGCAAKRVSEGIYHARQGDYDQAIESFRDAVRRDPQSAIAHYNLGYALSAHVRERCQRSEFGGTTDDLREANARFAEAVALDPDDYASDVATARSFNFTELYNLAIDTSGRGQLDAAEHVLGLAAIATDDALSAQRARVLGLQIEMSRALASSAADSRERYMRVLADLERIKADGPVDDTLVDEIENTLARARALLDAGQR